MRVVFEVDRASPARAVKLRRQADALVQFIAGIVEQSNVPAHVHVAICVRPGFGYSYAKTRRLQREDAFDRDG